jgi:signal transduction histidine kinase
VTQLSPAERRGWRALALGNWRVPWRLVALIVLPTAAGLVFAGLRVSVAAGNAATFGRVERLAVLGQQVTGLAQAMEDERDMTAAYIAAGRPASELAALRRQYAVTSARAAAVGSLARGVGAAYPVPTQSAAAAVLARIGDLADLRDYGTGSHTPADVVITDYSLAVADLFTLDDDIAQEGGNAPLVASVRALGALSRMKDQASQQQAILSSAYAAGQIQPDDLSALTTAQAQQAADLASFQTAAPLALAQDYANTVAGSQVDQAQTLEASAIVTGAAGGTLAPADGPAWNAGMGGTVARMRVVEQRLAQSIVVQARAQHQGATRSALLTGGAALALLLLVLLATVIIARSLMRPLRLLKAGALDIAEVRLPAQVRALAGSGGAVGVAPIGVHSTDEIGQVARAFDQVHREAVRLAADEARLRGSVSSMLVSLSRRSQSLLERLLRQIDTLEQGEQDPDRLASLFRMDHLATRMRRHSENLLVLAGHDPARRQALPVPLIDVARAAISEIEQYDRVTLQVQSGVSVTGVAVNDTVHLLAELLENATVFSARSEPVLVAGSLHASGGVLMTISDSGMGMTEDLLGQLNWRLEHPPVADAAVSRHMGLFAVAHLAARHGIRVRLRRPASAGLMAHVWLPGDLVARDTAPAPWPPPGPAAPAGPPAPARPVRQPRGLADTAPPGSVPAVPAAAAGMTPAGMTPAGMTPAGVSPVSRPGAAPVPSAPASWRPGAAVLPPAPEPEVSPTLPIFEAVESDWFRARGRHLPRRISDPPAGPAAGLAGAGAPLARAAGTAAAPAPAWGAVDDHGWRAAEAVLAPVTGGTTGAGLPRRTPQANLVPGAAGNQPARPPRPAEPPEAARSRLAGFQRGSLRARAAVRTPGAPR